MKKKKIQKLPKSNGKPFKKTKKADLTLSLKDLENTLGNCLIISGDEVLYSPTEDQPVWTKQVDMLVQVEYFKLLSTFRLTDEEALEEAKKRVRKQLVRNSGGTNP